MPLRKLARTTRTRLRGVRGVVSIAYRPAKGANATLDGLRGLNAMLGGTALPRLDEAKIEAMIARDTLALLGLAG